MLKRTHRLTGPFREFLVAISMVFLAFVTGCAEFGSISEQFFMMPADQEAQLGLQTSQEIQKESPPLTDPLVVSYIEQLGNKIWQASPNTSAKVATPHFYVIHDPTLNAFALPGGYMYVHTGLINAANDEAELAGVLAHEAAHVICQHSAKQIAKQQGLQMVTQLGGSVLGNMGTEQVQTVAQTLAGLASNGAMLNYSREDESEADAVAVSTLYRAGYDPTALGRFFEQLRQRYDDVQGIAVFLSSHPSTGNRITETNTLVAQLPQPIPTNAPKEELQKVQARLKELGLGDVQ